VDFSRRYHIKNARGIARKVQGGNDDIGIGRNAQHDLPRALGAVGRNLGVYVFGLQPTLSGIAVPELDGLSPFSTAEASLNGITHQLFRRNFFFRRGLLDLFDQGRGQFDVVGCHGYILLLFGENSTRLTIVNAY